MMYCSPLRLFLAGLVVLAGTSFGCRENDRNQVEIPDSDIGEVQVTQAQPTQESATIIDLGLPGSAIHPPGKLLPVDEGPQSPDFVAFRSQLIRAIAARDTGFIMDMVTPESKISFGAESGQMAFRIMWGLGEDFRNSELWDVLHRLIHLGGSFYEDDPGFFVAPYVYAFWPETYDGFTHAAITGAQVRIRKRPDLGSEILTALSFDIVGYAGNRTPESEEVDDDSYPWHEITLADGRSGWVYGKYLRSPIDFRAGFKQSKDRWNLAFLVAGD